MISVELPAEPRTSLGSGAARRYRRAGKIPGVLYGHGEPLPLLVDSRGIEKLLKSGAGANVVVNLKLSGVEETAIIRDIQRNSLSRAITHADFQRVLLTEKVTTHVSIELTGVAPATKEGGIVMLILREIEVEALPLDIPEHIIVDVSKLAAIGDSIHVRDLSMAPGVAIKTAGDITIVNIAAPAAEEAPVVAVDAAAAAAAEPEVLAKGKEENKDGKEAASAGKGAAPAGKETHKGK